MNRRRVVITGLGCISPVGSDAPATWEALLAGRSGVRRLPLLENEECQCKIGAPVQDSPDAGIQTKQDASRLGRSTLFALRTALEAYRDAGLQDAVLDKTRCGTVIGTGIGDAAESFTQTKRYLQKGARSVYPLYALRVMPNAAPAHVSLEFGFHGPSFSTASACASSSHAIGTSVRLIQSGEADLIITGGTEEAFSCVLNVCAFDALKALSRRNNDPAGASRPFDRDRDGMVLGEGAGMLVLEELNHALRRGARIYAEVVGVGMASEAYHITVPEPGGEGAWLAMKAALADAARSPTNVQYINAHGTSTPLNDKAETLAIRRLLGKHADSICVSATKSMIGHLIGASASIGVIATALSIHHGIVHPTINLTTPDPDCDLDYVPHKARQLNIQLALVNAFGFGGHCASLAIERFSPVRDADR